MTSAMTVRSDHRRTDSSRTLVGALRRNAPHHRSGREYDLVRGEGALAGAHRPAGPHLGDGVPREDLDAELLGEVQVVLCERVLGVEAAPGHAGPAVPASLPVRPGTTEERVHAGLSEVDADRR